MVNRKILNNVLKSVIAGKEDITPGAAPPPVNPSQPGTQDSLSPASQQELNQPVQRKRFYYYSAPPAMAIPFNSLTKTLNEADDNTRNSLVEKLKGGMPEYSAAYFVWKKLVISTTQYSKDGKKPVIYEVELSPDGKRQPGSEVVSPRDSGVTPEMFVKDIGLEIPKGTVGGNVIALDTSAESLYYNQDPPNNIVSIIQSGNNPPIAGDMQPLPYAKFEDLFNEFRMYSLSRKQILRPDSEISTTDGVPGGSYPGGKAAFDKIVGPVLQKTQQQQAGQPQQPSLKEKTEEKSTFQPVDEQDKNRVKGDVIDNPMESPMKKRFSSDNVRRMARRVLAGYIQEDSSDKDAISTGTTVKGIGGNPDTDEKTFKQLATQSRTKAKKYDEMAQVMKQFNDLSAP